MAAITRVPNFPVPLRHQLEVATFNTIRATSFFCWPDFRLPVHSICALPAAILMLFTVQIYVLFRVQAYTCSHASPKAIGLIRAEIARLEEAREQCNDIGIRRVIEGWIKEQKKFLADETRKDNEECNPTAKPRPAAPPKRRAS